MRQDPPILLIGGDESHLLTHAQLFDDALHALGIGRLGPGSTLPGDPHDDLGWGLTDWFDTTESQTLLRFQEHTQNDTLRSVIEDLGWKRRVVASFSPWLRVGARAFFAAQRKLERRGPYAAPWELLTRVYGREVLASRARSLDPHVLDGAPFRPSPSARR